MTYLTKPQNTVSRNNMKTVRKFLLHPAVALAGLVSLNACLYTDYKNVENIRATEIEKSAQAEFDKALAAEYKRLALYEADEMYDPIDAGTFAQKGLTANQGQRPLPEYPKEWNLKFGQQRLEDARLRLAALMSRDAALRAPKLAAKAQANYDCWVEQMEEGWQWDHIALCQNNFQQAVLQLEKEFASPQVITFNVNELYLDDQKLAQVEKIAAEAKRLDAPLASIVGYADNTGSKAYNMALSLARADEVAMALIKAGYPENRIAVSASGETQKTLADASGSALIADGSNRNLRRVEITFYPEYE